MLGSKQAVGNKMEPISFSDFLRNLNIEQKKQFKHYEKISYRIINTTKTIKFNNISLQGCADKSVQVSNGW